jgi:hypothetical protein
MGRRGPAPKHSDCGGPVQNLYVKVGPKQRLVPIGQICLWCGADSFRSHDEVDHYLGSKGHDLDFDELYRRFPHLAERHPWESPEQRRQRIDREIEEHPLDLGTRS